MAQSENKLSASPVVAFSTLSDIREDTDMWYRIMVLCYDLINLRFNHRSRKRLESTTNEFYVSGPYFTDSEAARILSAIVDHDLENGKSNTEHQNGSDASLKPSSNSSVQEMMQHQLTGFFDERKASGDKRPCGPHDMAPVYLPIFGISKWELKNKTFLESLEKTPL